MSELPRLTRYAWLSVLAALVTIVLKGGAYYLTDSVGLFSDALESLVNLVTAVVALRALTVAALPPDEEHAYGHTKAEYFSSGFEGALVIVAALLIAGAAVDRLLHPRPLDHLGLGLAVTLAASGVNLLVARVLFGAAARNHSIALEADAHHLMTDVWTSVGIVAGVGVVALTGWGLLDPLVALAVAANIARIGYSLIERSIHGLLDTALPPEVRDAISEVFARHEEEGIRFHALRTRQAGAHRFVSVHVLVPGAWTVQRGHDLLEHVEAEVHSAVPRATVFTHLEPLEDPVSWQDTSLVRSRSRPPSPPTRG